MGKPAFLINQCSIGAYFGAFTALGAKGLNKSDFRARGNTFGVAAPLTFKAASFQEHHCPYARSVVDRISLNICDQSRHYSLSFVDRITDKYALVKRFY
jgi:hypothetical protein